MNNKEATNKTARRLGRLKRTRTRAKTSGRVRLVVTRSNAHIYAQLIDSTGKVLAAANDMKLKVKKTEGAIKVGEEIAKKGVELKVSEVALDRSGYRYHGRVKALADAARTGGLVF